MNDLVALATLVVAFSVTATAHVAIAFGLVARRPRWHAGVALFVVPLAPYWALRGNMRVRGALWLTGVVGYAVARAIQPA